MPRRTQAFTLVELMVSMAILVLLFSILLQMTNQTATTWKAGAARAEQFSEARKAFETMTSRISNATLNTYLDYAYDPNITTTGIDPTKVSPSAVVTDYVRQSELRFRVARMSTFSLGTSEVIARPTHGIFFQAPFGMVDDVDNLGQLDDLLNSWGYFLEITDTKSRLPNFMTSATSLPRYRSRLMEFRQSAENFTLYTTLSDSLKKQLASNVPFPTRDAVMNGDRVDPSDDDWFAVPLKTIRESDPARPVRVLAENILALVILPKLSAVDQKARDEDPLISPTYKLLTPDFTYHSKQTSNYLNPPYKPPIVTAPTPKDEELRTAGPINPKNQLPPVVQIAMFAIDEASANRLALQRGRDLGIVELLQGNDGTELFTKSARLEAGASPRGGGDPNDPANKSDLALMEQKLIDLRMNYRVFTTNITVRGAKWSRAATK